MSIRKFSGGYVERLERGDSYVTPILTAAFFVGIGRNLLENATIVNSTVGPLYSLHNVAWYLAVLLSLAMVIFLLKVVSWPGACRVVAAGSVAGLFPPMLDVWVYGRDGFGYTYLFEPDWLFRMGGGQGYVGELIGIWGAISGLAVYIGIRQGIVKGVLGFVGGYGVFMLLGSLFPNEVLQLFQAGVLPRERENLNMLMAVAMLVWCALVHLVATPPLPQDLQSIAKKTALVPVFSIIGLFLGGGVGLTGLFWVVICWLSAFFLVLAAINATSQDSQRGRFMFVIVGMIVAAWLLQLTILGVFLAGSLALHTLYLNYPDNLSRASSIGIRAGWVFVLVVAAAIVGAQSIIIPTHVFWIGGGLGIATAVLERQWARYLVATSRPNAS